MATAGAVHAETATNDSPLQSPWQPPALPPLITTDNPFPAGRLRHFLPAWKFIKAEAWVLQVIEFGLKLKFMTKPPLTSNPLPWDAYAPDTHKGKALDTEIDNLLAKGAIEHVEEDSPGFYSLLFLQPKRDSPDWRPIIDLKPLNQFLEKDKFKMETPDSVRAALRPNMWCTSIDLKDAFFHIPVHPAHRKYLRFKTRKGTFQFVAMPFGLKTAPAVFTRIAKSVASYARSMGVSNLMYLDDWLLSHLLRATSNAQTSWMVQLTERLGWLINYDKSELESTQSPTFIGMFLDLVAAIVYPAPHRLDNLEEILPKWLKSRSLRAKDWQVLLGHLVSLERLIPRGRLHLRPFQNALAAQWNQIHDSPEAQCPIPKHLLEEVHWWSDRRNLEVGVPLVTPIPTIQLFTDASHIGWGGHIEDDMVSGLWSPQSATRHINFLELKAVQLALLHFSIKLQGQTVALMTDNTTVTAALRNQGSTRSQPLDTLAREILLWTDDQQITIIPRHVAGKLNVVADSLSRRLQTPTEWSLDAKLVERLWNVWGRPNVDMFATSKNAKLPTFVSPLPEATAWKVDALSFPWTNLFLYAFPPVILIRQVLHRIRSHPCKVILIAPWWPTQGWFTDLLSLCQDNPRTLPVYPKLLRHPLSLQFHPNPGMYRLHAFLLSGNPLSEGVLGRRWRNSLPRADERAPVDSTTTTGNAGPVGVWEGRLIHALQM